MSAALRLSRSTDVCRSDASPIRGKATGLTRVRPQSRQTTAHDRTKRHDCVLFSVNDRGPDRCGRRHGPPRRRSCLSRPHPRLRALPSTDIGLCLYRGCQNADSGLNETAAAVCVYYCRTYYTAVREGRGNREGNVLRETTSRGLCGLVCPSRTAVSTPTSTSRARGRKGLTDEC